MAPTNQSPHQGLKRTFKYNQSLLVDLYAAATAPDVEHDVSSLKVRMIRAQAVYEKLEDLNEKVIMALLDEDEDQMKLHHDLMMSASDTYTNMLTFCERKLLVLAPAPAEQPPMRKSGVKLPTLSLPVFDGKPENWVTFKDLFLSVIHGQQLSDVEKFRYLKSHVKIEGTSNVLDQYTLTEAGYANAWEALCNRYDDKRRIATKHLKALLTTNGMKKGSSSELRQLLDTFEANLSALDKCGLPLSNDTDLANALVVRLVVQCLDNDTRKEWNKFLKEDFATWTCMKEFLTAHWRSLDDFDSQAAPRSSTDVKATKPAAPNNSGRALVGTETQNDQQREIRCTECSEDHFISRCPRFLAMSVESRRQVVINNRLCWNCLSKGHRQNVCKSTYTCKNCKGKHHSLLHTDNPRLSPSREPSTSSSAEGEKFKAYKMDCKSPATASSNHANGVTFHALDRSLQTILPTVLVKVRDAKGKWQQCRALLDSGSDIHFITESCLERLGLGSYDYHMTVKGIDEVVSVVDKCVETQLFSNYGPFNPTIGMMVMKNLTGVLPHARVDTNRLKIPQDCTLADPSFAVPGSVDILIASDVYYQSLLAGKRELPGGTILVETKFGWTVVAKVPMVKPESSLLCSFAHTFHSAGTEVEEKLNKFLKADEFDLPVSTASPEQQFCEEYFQQTTSRAADGRFIVSMPFKESPIALGSNFENARKMFHIQEARRQKDEVYNALYIDYMRDYINTGHMTEVPPTFTKDDHFLPHHGVLKLSSTSTKLRPVFNASKRTETGISLNDVLCVGPTVQPESFDILSRFREYLYALISDITKMYRQIWIVSHQRRVLRILWREDPSQPLKHYELNTLTFGTACAPSIATRCIVQAAMDNENNCPTAAAAIRNCFYVDDLNYGTDNIEEGIKVRESIRNTLLGIGMTLCKFASNDPRLLENLPESVKAESVDNPNSLTRTLGIGFDTKNDEFFYEFKIQPIQKLTRASVLSQIASLYDPIGWIGPVVLAAKLIMKSVVMRNIAWEDILPEDLAIEWQEFHSKIPALLELRIPRHCYIPHHRTIELHGFSDASIKAYGAAVYARSIDDHGNIRTALLTSKSRVSPKNQKTLARLELCGMTLLSKLIHRMRKTIAKPVDRITLWSDSTICIHWLALEPQSLSTFVGNRTAVIRDLTHDLTWKHIRGADNPADVISRGLAPDEIKDCKLWWEGPSFLQRPQHEWPEPVLTINEDDPEVQSEVKRSFAVFPLDHLSYLVDARFSSVRKLVNTFAYMLRLGTRREERIQGAITIAETEKAERIVLRLVQKLHFPEDYKQLAEQKAAQLPQAVSKRSRLASLSPFLDDNDLMRVRGRLSACLQFSELQKHQIILPNCHFSTCLVRQIHEDTLHSNHQATLGHLRDRFWVLHAKDVVRKVIHKCITCFRVRPTTTNQLMSDLPASRVNMTPPFTYTAVDYTGHYMVKSQRGRFVASTKCYVCVFRCMCTGSIHIELVADLSTNAFIAALDRFFSRRGNCICVYSDNGTCFEGCDNQLRMIVQQHNATAEEHCRFRAIQWTFTTPRAPHAGGVYEIAVKLVKHHIKRVIGDSLFSFEEFQTILCKIEAVLNSRPLTPLSNNPNDLTVLTPGHFLTGRPLCSIPQKKFLNVNLNLVKRWERVQQAQQMFWALWYRDYLHEKQLRPQDFREEKKVDVGSLVLINDSNLPPLKWMLGRIVRLYPGKDGVVRSVRLHTAHGEKDRHVKYLSFLPTEQD